jgi:hypothetical protein
VEGAIPRASETGIPTAELDPAPPVETAGAPTDRPDPEVEVVLAVLVGFGVGSAAVPQARAAIDRMLTAAVSKASFRFPAIGLMVFSFILVLPCLLPAWVCMAVESVTSLF